MIKHLWYVHDRSELLVRIKPFQCLQALAAAARPSSNRLHLREVFVGGRRYQISQTKDGFTLTTTAKVWWHYRMRTRSAASLRGVFTEISDELTRVHLQSHIQPFQFFEALLMPLFVTSIIAFVPWPLPVILTIIAIMVILAWLGYRFNAAYESLEMVYFVQKALEDFKADILPLDSRPIEINNITRDFNAEWQRVYGGVTSEKDPEAPDTTEQSIHP